MTTKKKSVQKQIIKHMEDNGQKLIWLSKKVGISLSHLHIVLKGSKTSKRVLTPENLEKINQALRTNFKENI